MRNLILPAGAGYKHKTPGTSIDVQTDAAPHVAFTYNVSVKTDNLGESDDQVNRWDYVETYSPIDTEDEFAPVVVIEGTLGYDLHFFSQGEWKCLPSHFADFQEVEAHYTKEGLW
jgi:hypothetical protein